MNSDKRRQRVAVVQPLIVLGGGTEAVTAWTIEALRDECEVSLITFSQVDIEALNLYYGTELRTSDLSLVQPKLPFWLKRTSRFLFLKDHMMMRYCKSVRGRFDLFIGVGGVMDFGVKGIQYMALAPNSTLAKVLGADPGMPAWYRLFKRSLMGLSERVSGFSRERMRQNITMVTSQWAGKLVERLYGIAHYQVVYPPVNVPSANAAWDVRIDGFLCVARISPEKQIEQVIEILKRVRERGLNICLRILGRQDDLDYLERIQRLCQAACSGDSSWIHLDGLLTRAELRCLMDEYKYGINAATDEPFGIAVAEMVSAGCIVFVPNSGGQTEIVNAPQLTFSTVDEAVDKISNVVSNNELQKSLLDGLDNQRGTFSTRNFCGSVRQVAQEFFGTYAAAI